MATRWPVAAVSMTPPMITEAVSVPAVSLLTLRSVMYALDQRTALAPAEADGLDLLPVESTAMILMNMLWAGGWPGGITKLPTTGICPVMLATDAGRLPSFVAFEGWKSGS